ncbi:MAG TPA: fibronectin type III domain-containing protein [Candidatus Angelobacter sp.]|nr:fibronectin type III domain-containing protein [Candidatus Angelobacter sp.]
MKILSRISLLILMASFLAHGSSNETMRPKIIQGPVVVATGDKWAVIEWTTNAAGRSRSTIYAGTNKSDLRTVDQTTEPVKRSEMASYQEQQYTHLVRLNDLEPGSTYYFRVDAEAGYESGVSNILPLTTTKRPGRTKWGASIADHQ